MGEAEPRQTWLAWMVEREHPSGGPQYLTMTEHGSEWTDDPLVAMHFVRREDAERFAAGREDAEKISQHEFVDPPWVGQGPTHAGIKPPKPTEKCRECERDQAIEDNLCLRCIRRECREAGFLDALEPFSKDGVKAFIHEEPSVAIEVEPPASWTVRLIHDDGDSSVGIAPSKYYEIEPPAEFIERIAALAEDRDRLKEEVERLSFARLSQAERLMLTHLTDQIDKRHWFNVAHRLAEMTKHAMAELRKDLNPEPTSAEAAREAEGRG